MHQSGLVPILEILQVSQDDLGPYARIHVTIADKDIDIRWGLDNFTYVHLSKLLNTLFPRHISGKQYKCFLSFEKQTVPDFKFTGWVVCQLGSQNTRLSFECSELYKSNLEWLNKIEDIEYLEELSWENWIDSFQFNDFNINNDFETLKALLAEPKLQRRKMLIPVIILTILCTIGISGWLSFKRLQSVTPKFAEASHPGSVATKRSNRIANFQISANLLKPVINKTTNSLAMILDNTSQPAKAAEAKEARSNTAKEIYQLPAGEVALTFDDGPTEYTHKILQALADNHIHATFFFIGDNVKQWPDTTRSAAMAGNEVEDHSVDHRDIQKMSKEKQSWEILQAAKTIEQYINKPVTMFRPPYESFNKNTKQLLNQDRMALALWNQDPEDWKATSPEDVVRRVLRLPASGSVFILHDRKYTAEALPTIIQALKAKHLKFVLLQNPSVQT
jgi:peptidoglycan-N-acetylglucosamine deacetylase